MNWKMALFSSHQQLAKVTSMISLKLPWEEHIPPKLFYNSFRILFYMVFLFFQIKLMLIQFFYAMLPFGKH